MNVKWKLNNSEEIFNIKSVNDLTYLSFNNIEETELVKHAFSTRLGGVSGGEFSSMNLSFQRGDKEEDVHENFNRISKSIGVKKESLIACKQTHTANVQVVDRTIKGNGIYSANILEDVDGLVTNDPEVCLFTTYADCVPLYFLDRVNKVIGLSHSGWKGTVEKIGAETIRVMEKEFKSKPEEILVGIGPSICESCYEVSKDVADKFLDAFDDSVHNEILKVKGNDKYQLNLWRANEIILEEAGISKGNISTTNICTACNSELLFSHRISKGKRGNLGAFLALK